MLDLGAADMQVLMESMLSKLVARGRVGEALDVSRQARLEAARYYESIRTHLDRARRVPDSISWHDDLEPFLASSREHIDGRRENERQLLSMVTEHLQEAEDVSTRENLYRLKQSVDSEYGIHTQLLTLLGEAGGRYLHSQSALFRARSRQRLPNLDDRVLPELAQLPVSELAAWGMRKVSPSFPPYPRACCSCRSYSTYCWNRSLRDCRPTTPKMRWSTSPRCRRSSTRGHPRGGALSTRDLHRQSVHRH